MRNLTFPLLLMVSLLAGCSEPGPTGNERQAQVSSGQLDKYENFSSQYLAARDVQVWLPESYSADRKYAVLYMHDGQMLYDADVTWNKQEWGVDEVAAQMMADGTVQDFIIVGVFNGGETRHGDYLPEKPYRLLPDAVKERYYGVDAPDLKADEYIRFLADELKPFIDSHYSVYTDPAHTAVMGSSMGGLISWYALAERPDVFGMAACMSTHWPGFEPGKAPEMFEAFTTYMREHLPKPGTHRIYFDHGDATLDANYPPLQAKVDAMMTDLGYGDSNWQTVYAPGANHSEDAWKARLPGVFTFLFGK